MSIQCHLDGDVLIVRSVGDQSFDEGMAQFAQGIDQARAHFEATGSRVHLLFDMTESDESKSSDQLGEVVTYVRSVMPPLSGRVALAAHEDLMYGLSRIFSGRATVADIEAEVFRSYGEAWDWVTRAS